MFNFFWVNKHKITYSIFLAMGLSLFTSLIIADDLSGMDKLQKDAPKNWGKWGKEDQVGALNYLDNAQVLRGVAAIKTGERFTLQIPMIWIAEQSSRLKGLYHWPDGTNESALSLLKSHLPVVYSWLKKDTYIAAGEFTLADIYFYTLLTWAQQNNFDVPEYVNKYIKNLEQRSSFPKEAIPD